MSTFRDREKRRYESQKAELFSTAACAPGTYKSPKTAGDGEEDAQCNRRTFCLADGYSAENLYIGYRKQAIEYFQHRGIPWHDGIRAEGTHNPSSHLCCSQSACVNALWPLTAAPELLVTAFQPFLPQLQTALRMDADRLPIKYAAMETAPPPFLAFEWIGTQNYLKEGSWGTRGANATSADFAFRYRRSDNRIGLVLGEWKYTEYYHRQLQPPERLSRIRLETYQEHFARWNAERLHLPEYESFFSEPFYQLMRLTLLARAMERQKEQDGKGEMDADHVTVVYIAPAANTDLATSLTSPPLSAYGSAVSTIWSNLEPDRFIAIAAEDLLQRLSANAPEHLRGWGDYLLRRYGWWDFL